MGMEAESRHHSGPPGAAGIGTLLGLTVSPWFLALPLFVGGGLTVAGVTGFCGMAMLLMRAPWNRAVYGPAAGAR